MAQRQYTGNRQGTHRTARPLPPAAGNQEQGLELPPDVDDISPAYRASKVRALRASIAAGTYDVDERLGELLGRLSAGLSES